MQVIHTTRAYRTKRRVVFGLSILLLAMLYFFANASFTLRVATAIAFFIFFYVVDHALNIQFQKRHYIFIFIIGVASLLLSPLYFTYPQYDKIQHFIQPMLLSSIIFYMVNKLQLDMKWKITFTLCVVIAMLGLFEISEYTLDSVFDLKLQGVFLRDAYGFEKFNLLLDQNDDTMIDLSFGVGGSALYALWLALRHRNHARYHSRF